MTREEADDIVGRLRRGARLSIDRDIASNGDRELTEIMVAPGGTILRRDSTIPADGNTPCPPDACSQLSEEDLRVLLATHDYALLRQHLTRIPRAPDDPVEVVESGVTSRPFARICRLQARTVDELKAGARREGGDAMLDLGTHVVEGEGIPEGLRGTYVSATVVEWLD